MIELGLLGGDMHHTAHQQPVAGEGAEVGIVARFCGSRELDGVGLARLDELGVEEDVFLGSVRNVSLFHGLRVGEHGVGLHADGVEFADFDEKEIVRLGSKGSGVVQGELHFLAGFHGQVCLVVAKRVCGMRLEFDLDDRIILREGGHGDEKEDGERLADFFHWMKFEGVGQGAGNGR